LIFKEDEYYPSLLPEIYDSPDFIYVIGDTSALKTVKIAVVGSRRPSSYGLNKMEKQLE
jgi:DNA processing protein